MLEERKILTREKRTNAVTAYQGSKKELQAVTADQEIQQRIRTFSQDKKDEVYEALRLLSEIGDTVVIVHGVIGTAILENSLIHGQELPIWYSTNLDERDTILGSDEKLRDTVRRAYEKHRPKAIFILGTSVVAINNDDISTVILEMQEELPVKIISIYTDGFKSKTEINGIDIVLHALAKYILAECGEKINIVDIISITESRKNLRELERLADRLGIKCNIIPQFSCLEDIEKAGRAEAAIAVNSDEAEVLLAGLQEKSGVKSIISRVPIGIDGTAAWLSALGNTFKSADKAHAVIEEEKRFFAEYLKNKPFAGKKVFIALPIRPAAELALFLRGIGFEISGISVPYIDSLNKDALEILPDDLFIRIGGGQHFELANILRKFKPDFYIGTDGSAAWTAVLGIIPISVSRMTLYGYKGAAELIERLRQAQTANEFGDYLYKNDSLPYKTSWLKKSPDWYVKLEVK